MLNSILLVGALLLPNTLWAGQETHGGDAVVCTKDGKTTVELFDHYEMRHTTNLEIDLQTVKGDYLEKVDAVLRRLHRLDPVLADILMDWKKDFVTEMRILPRDSIKEIDDSKEVINVSKGCIKKQFAAQIRQPKTFQSRYLIDEALWVASSETTKAGLVLHELVYRFDFTVLHPFNIINSDDTRYFNAVLSSSQLETLTLEVYLELSNISDRIYRRKEYSSDLMPFYLPWPSDFGDMVLEVTEKSPKYFWEYQSEDRYITSIATLLNLRLKNGKSFKVASGKCQGLYTPSQKELRYGCEDIKEESSLLREWNFSGRTYPINKVAIIKNEKDSTFTVGAQPHIILKNLKGNPVSSLEATIESTITEEGQSPYNIESCGLNLSWLVGYSVSPVPASGYVSFHGHTLQRDCSKIFHPDNFYSTGVPKKFQFTLEGEGGEMLYRHKNAKGKMVDQTTPVLPGHWYELSLDASGGVFAITDITQ